MLTQQLRDLERHGLVNCVFFPEMPPHSEYSVAMLRRTLHPIFKSVCDGGKRTSATSRMRSPDTRRPDSRRLQPAGGTSMGRERPACAFPGHTNAFVEVQLFDGREAVTPRCRGGREMRDFYVQTIEIRAPFAIGFPYIANTGSLPER